MRYDRPIASQESMWSLAGHKNFTRYFDRQVLLDLVEKLRAKWSNDAGPKNAAIAGRSGI